MSALFNIQLNVLNLCTFVLQARLSVGDVVKCCIKKITYFGVFVEVNQKFYLHKGCEPKNKHQIVSNFKYEMYILFGSYTPTKLNQQEITSQVASS